MLKVYAPFDTKLLPKIIIKNQEWIEWEIIHFGCMSFFFKYEAHNQQSIITNNPMNCQPKPNKDAQYLTSQCCYQIMVKQIETAY